MSSNNLKTVEIKVQVVYKADAHSGKAVEIVAITQPDLSDLDDAFKRMYRHLEEKQ
jgi:hypothetical protein